MIATSLKQMISATLLAVRPSGPLTAQLDVAAAKWDEERAVLIRQARDIRRDVIARAAKAIAREDAGSRDAALIKANDSFISGETEAIPIDLAADLASRRAAMARSGRYPFFEYQRHSDVKLYAASKKANRLGHCRDASQFKDVSWDWRAKEAWFDVLEVRLRELSVELTASERLLARVRCLGECFTAATVLNQGWKGLDTVAVIEEAAMTLEHRGQLFRKLGPASERRSLDGKFSVVDHPVAEWRTQRDILRDPRPPISDRAGGMALIGEVM